MCMPQHVVKETRSIGKEEADAMGLNPGEVYGDEGGLEGDRIREEQRGRDSVGILNAPSLDPLGALGSFHLQQLPRIGAADLKRKATASPYQGLRINTPGKV